MYTIFDDQSSYILRNTDGAWIPKDPANADYQQYLKWLDDGNKPTVSKDVNQDNK